MTVVYLAHGASGNAASMKPYVDGLHARNLSAQAVGLPVRKAEEVVGLYRDQVAGSLMNQFARFGNELFMQRVHVGAPERTEAWRTRSCCDTGLTR